MYEINMNMYVKVVAKHLKTKRYSVELRLFINAFFLFVRNSKKSNKNMFYFYSINIIS